MADYYLQTSFCISGSKDELEALVALLDDEGADGDESLYIEHSLNELEDRCELCIWAEDCFNVDALAERIHKWLVLTNRDAGVEFSYSASCSRMEIDSFTGDTFYITKDGAISAHGLYSSMRSVMGLSSNCGGNFIITIKCAYADLVGAYQDKRDNFRDWGSHLQTIRDMERAFPFLDKIEFEE